MLAPWVRTLALGALTNEFALRRARTRLSAPHTLVLMYHEVLPDDAAVDSWTVVRRSDLLRQIDYVGRYYDVVSIDRAREALGSGRAALRPLAVLTFDDGTKGNIEVLLPLIESLGLPVTIYVASGHIESQRCFWFDRVINALQVAGEVRLDLRRFHGMGRYQFNRAHGARGWVEVQRLLEALKQLTPARCEEVVDEITTTVSGLTPRTGGQIRPLQVADVRSLAASPLVQIGGHSHCHTLLTMLGAAARRESIAHNKKLLELWTGCAVRHFAYPSGVFDSDIVEAVRESGYRTAVTTAAGVWLKDTDVLQIPRWGVGRYDSDQTFKAGCFGGPMGLAQLLVGRSSPATGIQ